jgi:hypothetical protein
MALEPTKWIESVLEVPATWSDGTEQIQQVRLKMGYYVPALDPGEGGSRNRESDDLLIESDRTITNRYGTAISREVESWSYDVYKGPPIEYNKESFSNVYLPGIGGRLYRKVEEEKVVYWTFSPFTDGDNLGKTRMISGWVIYNLKVEEYAMPAEERQKIIDAGMSVPTFEKIILSSGRYWREASLNDNIVEDESSPQVAMWKDDVIVEHDVVDEQPDRWIIWTVRKNTLRPGVVETIGPTEIKKTGFSYRIPYPIGPPEIELTHRQDGILIEAHKGGALVTNSWFPINDYVIQPEQYRIYRKKLFEPDRTPEEDPYGWWKTPPVAPTQTSVIEDTEVTDFSGAAASALPGQTSYTEPHDPTPIDPPDETSFQLIATVDNTKDRHTDEAYGSYVDKDLVSGGEYEYYATAVIVDDESPDSNHETMAFNGAHDRWLRIGKRALPDGSVETDALAPDDPSVPGIEDEMGETVSFEVPTEDDPVEVTEEIAERVFATSSGEDLTIDVEVLLPLFGLEYGQRVIMPQVVWQAFGSDRILTSQTIDDEYMLSGFKLRFERDESGSWTSQKTLLKLKGFSR